MKQLGSRAKVIIFALVVALVISLLTFIPFVLMILLGAFGHETHNLILAISFKATVFLVFIIIFVGCLLGGWRN